MINIRPILVTGSPRSGTTWIGRMLAQASSVRYIHEPFNISKLPCYCGVNFDYWFYYVSSINESNFLEHIEHTIHPAFDRISVLNLLSAMKQTRQIRPLKGYILSFLKDRTVVKDPIALFSAPWLAKTYDMNVVVVIRHPAAVVSSYKRLNWTHPFSHFLKQSALMEDHLTDFAAEITDFAQHEHDIVDQAALLWKLIHHMILKYRQSQPEWIFVRHMDIARDPINGFQTMFNQLSLPFSDQVKQSIQHHSMVTKSAEINDPYSIQRHSVKLVGSWKDQLCPEEITRIRKRVEAVSYAFFEEEDW